jgi:RNA polymerase sigma factor (sigma-70 family)
MLASSEYGLRSGPAAVMSSPGEPDHGDAAVAVTALYRANALSLIRLAHVLLGDRGAAEDVVQDAFSGLYRRWAHVSDHDKALSYVRSSVINACRSALRRVKPELSGELPGDVMRPDDSSGETAVLDEEERVKVMAALRRLPSRQREVLVLRFYLDKQITVCRVYYAWTKVRASPFGRLLVVYAPPGRPRQIGILRPGHLVVLPHAQKIFLSAAAW